MNTKKEIASNSQDVAIVERSNNEDAKPSGWYDTMGYWHINYEPGTNPHFAALGASWDMGR